MKWLKNGESYWVRLDRDEEVMEALVRFLDEAGLPAATITGLGALKKTELAFFDARRHTYTNRTFPMDLELVSFLGNATFVDGKRFVHAHAILSGADFECVGGHFLSGIVAVTMECHVIPGDTEIHRKFDKDVGLNLQVI